MFLKWIQKSRFLHAIFNSFLFGNSTSKKGKNSVILKKSEGICLNTKIKMLGNGNSIEFSEFYHLKNTTIVIKGNGNRIVIGPNVKIIDGLIWILGDENSLEFAGEDTLNRTEIALQYDNNSIDFERHVISGGFMQIGKIKNETDLVKIYAAEGTKIQIKERASLAEGVKIRSSDSHPIFQNDSRINHAKDIVIGSHTWIGANASLFKGAKIGDNSIVGAASFVSKDFSTYENVMLVGNPANIIKENVRWDYSF